MKKKSNDARVPRILGEWHPLLVGERLLRRAIDEVWTVLPRIGRCARFGSISCLILRSEKAAFSILEPLLEKIQSSSAARAKRLITTRGRSFLHFEDPVGLFADLIISGEDMRLRVNEAAEQGKLLDTIISYSRLTSLGRHLI